MTHSIPHEVRDKLSELLKLDEDISYLENDLQDIRTRLIYNRKRRSDLTQDIFTALTEIEPFHNLVENEELEAPNIWINS